MAVGSAVGGRPTDCARMEGDAMGNRKESRWAIAIFTLMLLVGSLVPAQVLAEDLDRSCGSTELWVRYDAGRGGGRPSHVSQTTADDAQIRRVVTSAKTGVGSLPRLGDAAWWQPMLAVAMAVGSVAAFSGAYRRRGEGHCGCGKHLVPSICVLVLVLANATSIAWADDFGSTRLLISSNEQPECGTVLSDYEGVWLVEFPTQSEAHEAYEQMRDEAEFVAPDITFEVADSQDVNEPQHCEGANAAEESPQARLDSIGEVSASDLDVVALIDTGVSGHDEHVVQRLSVIGDELDDDHGHGTSMLEEMVAVDPSCQVVSIKALDSRGVGTAASMYAAIQSAIQMNAKVINLSVCAPASQGNEAVEQAILDAWQAGIMVVGAAGNDGEDACGYVPGCMGDEAVVVGSCDDEGTRLPQSNFGDTVDLYVPSPTTSVAAARSSARLCADGTFGQELECLEGQSEQRTDVTGKTPEEVEPKTEDELEPEASTSQGQDGDTGHGESGAQPCTEPAQEQTSIQEQGSIQGQTSIQEQGSFPETDPKQEAEGSQADSSGTAEEYPQSEDIDSVMQQEEADASDVDPAQPQQEGRPNKADDLFRVAATKYTLTVRTNGGQFINPKWGTTTYSSKELEYNESTYCEINWLKPQRTGYAFAGWYTSASGGTMVYGADGKCRKGTYWNRNYTNGSEVYIYKGDLTVYAHWTPLPYRQVIRVRFQLADGSYGEYSNVLDEDRDYGTTVSWSRNATATHEAASVSYVVAQAKTTSISIKRKTYAVSFKANGGSGAMDSQTFYRGQAKALRKNAFERDNYKFVEWNTKANGSGTSYANREEVINLAAGGETVTLYAQWSPQVYKITLDNQSATSAGSTAIYEKYATGVYLDSACTKPMTTSTNRIVRPNRQGYTFDGFFTQPNGAGYSLITPSGFRRTQLTDTYFSQASTLYAHWVANSYTIRYDGNGATGTMASQTVADDAAGTRLLANQFQKSGHVFKGWSLESTPREAQDMSSTSWWSIPSQASVRYDVGQGKNTVELSTVSGSYENITCSRPIRVIPGRTYRLSCMYRTIQSYVLASGYSWFGLSIHSVAQGNSAPSEVLAHTSFSTAAMAEPAMATATFTVPANVYTVFLSLNGGNIVDGRSAMFEIGNISITSDHLYADQETVRDLGVRGTVTMNAQWATWDYVAEFVNLNKYADVEMPSISGGSLGDAIVVPACEDAENWEFLGWEVLNGPKQGETLEAQSRVEGLAATVGSRIVLAAKWRLRAVELAAHVVLTTPDGNQMLMGGEYTFKAHKMGADAVAVTGTNDDEGLVSMRLEGLSLNCGDAEVFCLYQVGGGEDGIVYDLVRAKAVVSVGGTSTAPIPEILYAKPEEGALVTEVPTFVNRLNSASIVVTFDPACDDATGEMDDLEIAEGESLTLPPCAFERELFEFAGWNTQPNESGALYMAGDEVKNVADLAGADGVVVFHARWEAKQLSIAVPVAIHFVADSMGEVTGPTNDVATIENHGETCAEVAGIRSEAFEPWELVSEYVVCDDHEFSLGMVLGNDSIRLDFAALDGANAHFARIDPLESLALNDLWGHAGSAEPIDENVGCLHWRFRAVQS